MLVDIILGILGRILGGWIFGLLGIWQGGRRISSIIVAFIGAVILVAITRLLKKAWVHFHSNTKSREVGNLCRKQRGSFLSGKFDISTVEPIF